MNKHGQDATISVINSVDHELQSSLIKAIIDASPEGILVVDSKGDIVSINRQFFEAWRIPVEVLPVTDPEEIIGTQDHVLLQNALSRVKDRESFLARVRELYDNPALNDHCEIEMADGRTLERHSTVLRSKQGEYLGRVWFFRDITLRKQTENALTKLAHHDPLTGVANRRYFFLRASQEFSRSRRHGNPLCVAGMDIDHFKQINDRYGHAAGDEILKMFCDISLRSLRDIDLFARLGGEEFAVLLPDTDLKGARVAAERIRKSTAETRFELGNGTLNCTVSIGIAALEPIDTSIEECLSRADSALYRAKENGRNRVEIAASF